MIDGHGDDLWRYGDGIRHNFSTNIYVEADYSGLLQRMSESGPAVTHYPCPEPMVLEKKLSETYGSGPENYLVTNGATEAIYMIAREFSGKQSAIWCPTFREYQDAARLNGHDVKFIERLSDIPEGCDVVWLCSPNNPTGEVIPYEELVRTIDGNPDTIFVVDQSYSPYATRRTLTEGEAVRAGNVILLGSLTKRFGVPGLRLGYAVGTRSLLDRIRKWRLPWSVGGLAIEGGLYLLDNIDKFVIDNEYLHSEASRMGKELEKAGISVSQTDCNFILCRLPRGAARDLKTYLAETAGILIRDASNFEGLDGSCFRVAAQSEMENNQLVEEIRRWLDI